MINQKELYQENKGRKVKVFDTSMIKGIRNKESNFYLERCHAELKSYL